MIRMPAYVAILCQWILQVRGLWLQHDSDRQKLTGVVKSAILELERLGSDDGSEINEIDLDSMEAAFGEKPGCGAALPGLDWIASDGTALGATLVAKAEELAEVFAPLTSHKAGPTGPSWRSLGGQPIQAHQVDTVRASTLSLFPCVNGCTGGTSNARELWSDDQGLRTLDAMEFNMMARTLTLGIAPRIPVASGNEGL